VRVLAWALAGLAALALGLAVLAGVGLAALAVSGNALGDVERATWLAVGRAVLTGALLPVLGGTLLLWTLAAWLRPAWDARWGILAPGVATAALACFPPAAAAFFTAWTPGTVWNYLGTWLWISGAVTTALLLPRWLLRALAPGALATRRAASPGPPEPPPAG
jgi:hypothetical protein